MKSQNIIMNAISLRTHRCRMSVAIEVDQRNAVGSCSQVTLRGIDRWLVRPRPVSLFLMAAMICLMGMAAVDPVAAQTISTESTVLDLSQVPEDSAAVHAGSFRKAMSHYFVAIKVSAGRVKKAKTSFEQAPTPKNEAALYNTVAEALTNEKNALETIIIEGMPLDEQIDGLRTAMRRTIGSIDSERAVYELKAAEYDREAEQRDHEILDAAQTFSSLLDSKAARLPWDERLAVAMVDDRNATLKRMSRDKRTVAQNTGQRKERYGRRIAILQGYSAQVKAAISSSRMRVVELHEKAGLMLAECQHARQDREVDVLVGNMGNLGSDVSDLRKKRPDWTVPSAPDTAPLVVDDGDSTIKARLRKALVESRATTVALRDDPADEPSSIHDKAQEIKQ